MGPKHASRTCPAPIAPTRIQNDFHSNNGGGLNKIQSLAAKENLCIMSSVSQEPRWPPRSPHEALLSSPSGRIKIRQFHDRTSPSPSPLKRSATTPNLNSKRRTKIVQERIDDEWEGEEDEETLQLQLQTLEAKLKLKRLQQKRKAAAGSSPDVEKDSRPGGRSSTKENRPPSVQTETQASRPVGTKGQTPRDVQIPASPQKSMRAQENAQSPKKVLLGIDKGLKGRNISLKRAPSDRSRDDDPFQTEPSPGHRSASRILPWNSALPSPNESERPRASFSAKIALARQEDTQRREHTCWLRKQQSTGFSIAQEDIANAQRRVDDEVDRRSKVKTLDRPLEFSREEILKAASQPNLGRIGKSNITSSLSRSRRTGSPTKSTDIWMNPNAEPELPRLSQVTSTKSHKHAASNSPPTPNISDRKSRPSSPTSTSDPLFESFSSIHLSSRLLPHDLLTKAFSAKSILRLPDLLSSVKSPHYALPDNVEADYVVLAIIASKSCPLSHKDKSNNHRTTSKDTSTSISEAANSEQNTNGKYMVITLTDLKWSLDLYLFSTGYTRFWKLTPGTVISLLNPSIMPPPPGKADTGRFSLTLSSSDDTVLEIGRSRDLAWCSSMRKDGKACGSWVDARHTSVCEYHVDRAVERTRSARMEVAGMSAPFAPGGRKGGRTGHFGGNRKLPYNRSCSDGGGGGETRKPDGFIREGPQYDRSSHSTYFMGPAPGAARSSTAQLLDAEGFQLDRVAGSKAERTRKRLAEREREQEIARRLSEGGNGAGSEYLRLGLGSGGGTEIEGEEEGGSGNVEAESLGLKRNRAGEVHLSPLKKRRVGLLGAAVARSRARSAAGGGESVRKKTRFVTEKGIRVAGRDSLGGSGGGEERWKDDGDARVVEGGDDDDDDDGLEVV